tara:strand:- start:3557 stop:3814 length:258 start_codon:yes stop_codon:yes gene_type:complete
MNHTQDDTNLLFLISNPYNIIKNNNQNIVKIDILKQYIIKKFDLINEELINILYNNISDYINKIDLDLLIINNILNNIIEKIVNE